MSVDARPHRPFRATADGCCTFVDLMRWRAIHHPHRTAVVFLQDGGAQERRLSYGDLDAEARRIAAFLQHRARPGDTALLLYPAGTDFITAFFGCLYAGVVAIPLQPPHPRRPATRLHAVADDARPPFVLSTADLVGEIVDRGLTGALRSAQWLATDSAELAANADWIDPQVDAESLAFLQYTSGSTAAPKGVMVSHANILHNERMIQAAAGHTENLTMVGWLPLYHDMGLIGNLLQPLFVGGRAVLMAPAAFLQRPHLWLQAISTYRAQTSGGPNFGYELCVRRVTAAQRAGLDLSSWRTAFNGAEPICASTLGAFSAAFGSCGFREEAFFPCYGLAEATLLVAARGNGSEPFGRRFRRESLKAGKAVKAGRREQGARTLVACGRPSLDERVLVVDPESREPRRAGRIGEIWVAGPHVAQGYWNAADASVTTFEARLADGRGPFLRTGDLGFVHEGELFVAGRLTDLITIGGRHHHPQDIERTAEASCESLQAGGSAAFSVEGPDDPRLVVAAEVGRHFRRDAAGEAVSAIRQAIAHEHGLEVDAVVLIRTGTMFKTSSGKTQRYACRDAFLADGLSVIARWPAGAGDVGPLPRPAMAGRPAAPGLEHMVSAHRAMLEETARGGGARTGDLARTDAVG